MTKFIAVTTRVNVNGKTDYPFIYCCSNGAPVMFESAAQALEKATALCADSSSSMTDPRAELAA
jgi:hypothetical protein